MYSEEQIVNGLVRYADQEILAKMPLKEQIIASTALFVAVKNKQYVFRNLRDNEYVKMLGVVNENKEIDAEAILDGLKESLSKYGNLKVELPFKGAGSFTFTPEDADLMKRYIKGEL